MNKLFSCWKRRHETPSQTYKLLDKDVKKLHRAASLGDLKKLKKYIQVKKYDVNSQDEEYRTGWGGSSIQCQKEDCANILLNYGADPNLMDFCYNTALHYAVCGKSFSLVEKLLKHKADLEAKNKDGCTPLLLAVIKCNPKMLKFLLDKGADVNATDNYQRTALIIAVSGEATCVQRSLLQKGVELSSEEYAFLNDTHNQWRVMERRKMLSRHLILGTTCD
uniref:Ankyrin repeat domain 7 n=1 Tax=Saimiri boliviensis boliviensis TaxID=39432 RepID=A0A2K6SR41_SAIBB